MSLTTEDFTEFMTEDPEDDTDRPFGDALEELSVDVETDAVQAVRDMRVPNAYSHPGHSSYHERRSRDSSYRRR